MTIDHAATARDLIAAAEGQALAPALTLALAQVHATLAVAESVPKIANAYDWPVAM